MYFAVVFINTVHALRITVSLDVALLEVGRIATNAVIQAQLVLNLLAWIYTIT